MNDSWTYDNYGSADDAEFEDFDLDRALKDALACLSPGDFVARPLEEETSASCSKWELSQLPCSRLH